MSDALLTLAEFEREADAANHRSACRALASSAICRREVLAPPRPAPARRGTGARGGRSSLSVSRANIVAEHGDGEYPRDGRPDMTRTRGAALITGPRADRARWGMASRRHVTDQDLATELQRTFANGHYAARRGLVVRLSPVAPANFSPPPRCRPSRRRGACGCGYRCM